MPRPKTADRPRPLVSVVVVAHNERETIGDCLRSLGGQSWPQDQLEVIVVDDGSTDGTADAARRALPGIRVITKEQSGPDTSRAHGVRAAAGDIICFIDADCTASAHWIGNAVSCLEEGRSVIVGGRIRHAGGFWARVVGASDFGEFLAEGRHEVGNIPTCNMGIRRDIFDRFGFDPRLPVGGDAVFCRRLNAGGHRLVYDSRVEVTHRPRVDFRSFLARARRYGEWFVFIRRIEPSLRGARLVRLGLPGAVAVTLGRTLLDWKRLLLHWKAMGFAWYEVPPAAAALALKRCWSVPGAVKGCLRPTAAEATSEPPGDEPGGRPVDGPSDNPDDRAIGRTAGGYPGKG